MDDREYSEIIMKPQLAGFKSGFKHYKTVTDKSIDSYMKKIKSNGFENTYFSWK